MNSGPVILQLAPLVSDSGSTVCTSTFTHHGLVVTRCATLPELIKHVWDMHAKPDGCVVAILDGRGPNGVSLVSALRASRIPLGIVALVNSEDEANIIQLLRTGIDAHCSVDASPNLLVAVVLRLLWRMGVGQPNTTITAASALKPPKSTAWQLADRGWTLCSPAGVRVTLTTGERAFLSTLLYSPLLKVAHAQLIDAVNAAYNHTEGCTHQSRLGVMVSRMRRKFQQAGAPLPLKSVHNWGYMFVIEA